ncbi:hypothetical protein TWF696_006467 [Orbilia brochopaga]|uniref:Fido domain-containing protein n=1 Tax=Orbilia brochopaga TaxID=3140254 RepID=A0AAV9UZ69_9PEZI
MFRAKCCQRLAKPPNRSFSTATSSIKDQRNQFLKKIYAPFRDLTAGSPEYEALAATGTVWEDYFKPSNISPYLKAQSELKNSLAEIDRWKPLHGHRDARPELARALVTEYSHQSCAIEANPLSLGDGIAIRDGLNGAGALDFPPEVLADPLDQERILRLAAPLPSPESLLPNKDRNHVAELRNHMFAYQLVVDRALHARCTNTDTAGMDLDTVKLVSRLLLTDTDSEALYSKAWGGPTALGDFRKLPIMVRSNPLRVFPYPQEVPAIVDRFFKWRDIQHRQGTLHPLILATKICVYFVHIHPFLDGNGRTSRLLMADYLVRRGLLPVVFQNLERREYLQMISDAEDGDPMELCESVVATQLDMLWSTGVSKPVEVDVWLGG